jgi:hypothetical protein
MDESSSSIRSANGVDRCPVRDAETLVHVVCDNGSDELVAVTVYIPKRPHWLTAVNRGLAVSGVRGTFDFT